MKDCTSLSVNQYLDAAASGEAVPGGGSVAAITGALAASMASMVGAFTLASPKLAGAHPRFAQLRAETERLRASLSALAQADIDAYAVVSAAYALPKSTDAEKAARKQAIRQACQTALKPPLSMARELAALSQLLPEIAADGNRNLISDAGVAALLCEAAFESAALNVSINLKQLAGEADVATLPQELAALRQSVADKCRQAASLAKAAVE